MSKYLGLYYGNTERGNLKLMQVTSMQACYILSYSFYTTTLEILIDAASKETWKIYKMLQNYHSLLP